MEHKIRIKINDRSYVKVIQSEDEEAQIRAAAREIEADINQLQATRSSIPLVDIATVVALNKCIDKNLALRGREEDRALCERVSADLCRYVDSLK